ncbi:MAG: 60S ribosomal export protein NMD3 [Candidatus Aenigmarchaeota archaeon]|nr:60S ribosomal export protein NMD3 [Candidatus Aenigmarchaeota archaeon]
MKGKFCPKCGEETEKFYENLCKDCFLEKISFLDKIPEEIVIRKCKSCEKFFYDEKSFKNLEEAVGEMLARILEENKIQSINYRIFENKVNITLTFRVEDLEKTEEKKSSLILKSITCNSCSLKNLGYYQAVLQVRAPENLLEKISQDVENFVEFFRNYDALSFISKFEKQKKGFDVFIGSKKVAHQIAQNLKRKYKPKIKISRKFAGRIKGKKVYRDTILISLSD